MDNNKKSADPIVPRQSVGGRGEVKSLSPEYVTGFVDGEGCFAISIGKRKTRNLQSRKRNEVRCEFEIELREDDREILERIQKTLGCGNIYILKYQRYGWRPHVKYRVQSVKDFKGRIIPFFKKHPLQAKKRRSFKVFCKAVDMMDKKVHLKDNGHKKFRILQRQMRQSGKKRFSNR